MPDKPWKKFEREVAELIGGRRYAANSGNQIDVEGHLNVVQCKLVKRMSLEDLTQLTETTAAVGRAKGKLGMVAIKVRRGAGHPSPTLLVMMASDFASSKPKATAKE